MIGRAAGRQRAPRRTGVPGVALPGLAVAGVAVLGVLLAACSTNAGADRPADPKATAGSSTPDPTGSGTASKKPAAQTKPAPADPFETKGFTIRYLDKGKVKKIDVPDFDH